MTPRQLTIIALGTCEYMPEHELTVPGNIARSLGIIPDAHKNDADYVVLMPASELAGLAIYHLYLAGETPSPYGGN